MAEGTPIDIEYVARLARISLSPQEKETFRQQLGEILEYFERIAAVDIRGIEPTAHAFPLYNVWGEDIAEQGFDVAQALSNAPDSREDQFNVPKVLEDS